MKRGHRAKNKRRKDAEKRAAQREGRTDQQQIAKLDAEGRTATKERARLNKRIKN